MTLRTAPLWDWVNERHAIYVRKEIRAGADPADLHVPKGADLEECDPSHLAAQEDGPLTNDLVMRQYRFCNVFRELDRVTRFVDAEIRKPFALNNNLWFMLAAARYINWPPTLRFLMNHIDEKTGQSAWPESGHAQFNPRNMGNALDLWKSQGNKVYTGAYMIRAESNPNADWYCWSKQQYVAQIVLGRLWQDRDCIRRCFEAEQSTLKGAWAAFQSKRYVGWGPFMAYQVVADLRHTRYLQNATDINTWAALGPGSKRGLNRLAGRPLSYNLNQEEGLDEMRSIWAEQDAHRAPWVPPIELGDIQNSLCEVDKLLRVRSNEGRPRARYVPGRGW